jgi:serine/threonine protein kinase
MMTPERLGRIRAVYEAASHVEADEIDAFLEQECGGDRECEQQVKRLLGARGSIPTWLSEPLLGHAGRIIDSVRAFDGKELRGYKLIREIGLGGMGSVYLAERSDGAYTKQVAVKLVRAGQDNAEIAARFQREREILAALDHPNIARLIDGGSTEEGVPYFVMEFVDGRPITQWCDDHQLNVSQRITLFRSVCSAVEYAHQRLVVHCDLKPGNILVTSDGTVKLLDFGIAKVLKQERIQDDDATVTLMKAMTPEYASPEQMKGESLNTLTDVYSLGVVLYELLTGRRPYHLPKAAFHEVVRIIAEEEPTRPSDVVTRGHAPDGGHAAQPLESTNDAGEGNMDRLRRRLVGDLDSILLTALQKEPPRRYSSVEALNEDLRRHLDHLPVNAREDTLWYRAAKFIRRHPGGVTAIAITGLLGTASTVAMFWELRVALDSARHLLPARTIVAPQLVLWGCMTWAILAGAAYALRARLARIAGALAGGLVMAIIRLLGLRYAHAMGWWSTRFTNDPDPLSVLFAPVLLLVFTAAIAAFLLVGWRLGRRFGWRWQMVLVAVVAVWGPFRERLVLDRFMQVIEAPIKLLPVMADIAFWATGLLLGYAAMRLVAGPDREGRLARMRPLEVDRAFSPHSNNA